MAITSSTQGEFIRSRQMNLTPLNLYVQRVGSISNRLRAESAGYTFLPFQLGGISNQQLSLASNVVVSTVDFKVSGDEK